MSARRTASAGGLDSYYRNVLNNIPGAAPFDVCKAFSFLEMVDKKSIPPHLANIMIQSLQQFRLKSKTQFPSDISSLSKPAQDLYYQFRQAQNWKQIVHVVTLLEPPNMRGGWLPFPPRFFEARYCTSQLSTASVSSCSFLSPSMCFSVIVMRRTRCQRQ